ncbi:MAG TPA: M28 family peptidase [Candidatus Aminicenantes bacterium]|nr:M28 family peptidase [Candidatus Aminicenantes bacterium]HRY65710.1 M28 family peptidase [Candidatus Aminicenantes bacterium]HRZ72624.1 M28 family peptidase [Candidatus Aminicenantes bacterium]
MRHALIVAVVLVLAAFCCGSRPGVPAATAEFDAASAYAFVKAQVDFGPRVPGTPAHAACADWFVKTLRQWTPDVVVQEFKARAFDGRPLEGQNIAAAFNPAAAERILLCAHWDSRPFADHDPDPANRFRPVTGANDGASGAGVLLEVARCLALKKPAVGVDILLLDLEDFGEHANWRGRTEDCWGLGSQHWARQPHREGYRARFGILLDMVGGADAVFPMEGTSMSFAPAVVRKVWAVARGLGLGRYFIEAESDPLIDDHLYINRDARIPTIDIIDYDAGRGGFPASWHTVGDTLDKIDRKTLAAVGRTVLAVIEREK